MALATAGHAPNIDVFLKSLRGKTVSAESCIENLISLLKRRQIRNSRPCAIATAHLLLKIVAKEKWNGVDMLIRRVQDVGRRLVEAQPREMVVGNIVRRVLGMIRDEAKEDREEGSDSASASQTGSPRPQQHDLPSRTEGVPPLAPAFSSLRRGATDFDRSDNDDVPASKPLPVSRPPLVGSHTSYAVMNGTHAQQSMFNLLSATPSPSATPPNPTSPHGRSGLSAISLEQHMVHSQRELKSEVITGIEEIIDELEQVDKQIADYSLEHIHSNEVILTHSSSTSVQKFLLKAALKRKFTIIVVESFPNDHKATHGALVGKLPPSSEDRDELSFESFKKPLSSSGITVILIPDSAVFAIMSRVNKVLLATHAVIANGGLVAAAGARVIANAANIHRVPVIVVSGVYKLSPDYPFEFESLIEYGDPGNVIPFDKGALVADLEIDNPLFDYVPPDLVDLYITNLGAHAPSYLYRIVADHYKPEDINFHKPELQF